MPKRVSNEYVVRNIGLQLQAARERRGLTQRAFAKSAGTTQSRISKIENGDVDPRISSLVELARSLDLEFMLVPRQHVPAVRAIIAQQPHDTSAETDVPRPAYRLDEEDDG